MHSQSSLDPSQHYAGNGIFSTKPSSGVHHLYKMTCIPGHVGNLAEIEPLGMRISL